MKTKILITIGVIIGIIGALGAAMPKHQHVEREIMINAPRAEVFNYLNNIKNQEAWSPWLKMDPNAKIGYSGPDSGVGAISTWDGNKDLGKGTQEIKSIVKNERINVELKFEKPMEGTSQAYFITEEAGEKQTKVKWGFDSEMKFPCNIFSFFMQGYMEDIFDKGLADLKAELEK
jgi:uncharacterized protein YndB with AHSA1/START domain